MVLKGLKQKNLTKYKYELIEKILIELPKKYKNQSFVILDGKFCNIDPYLGTNFHLLSDVKYSKIETVEGYLPKFKNKNKKYINRGLINSLKDSNYSKFIKRSSNFLPFLKNSKYMDRFMQLEL